MSSQHNARWVFERVPPMGGARSTAYQDTLEGSDFSAEVRIAREAIQNSADATLTGLKTEVLVWDKPLSEQDRSAFRELLDLDSPDSPTSRLDKLGLKDENFFERVKTREGEVRVTIIEDHNTCGLGFDRKTGKNRFEELCLFLGQDETNVDSDKGGSYGFGKTVYQASSGCRTFLVYSAFEPKPELPDRCALLFGCSLFSGHSMGGEDKYTGRAWFSVPKQDEFGQHKCDPIENEAAHELAERLGFSRRQKDDFGTSIMILDSKIDIESFREAVEDYWWPRLISDQLFVELWVGDVKMPSPELLLRSKLLPYIRCFNLVEDDIPVESDERRPRLNPTGGAQIGKLALKALPPNDPDEDENPDQDTHFRNTVALIWTSPRMVVEYLDTGGRQRGNFAGAFVSHSDSEQALHLSEPPAHNAWNPNSKRLREASPDYPELVKSILGRIKQHTRRFQKELSPAPPPEPVAGSRKLEQILAGVMSSRGLGPPSPPPPVQAPFQLRIREGRTNTPTGSTVTATVDISLWGDTTVDEADVLLSVRPTVVLDDNLRRDSSERLKLACATVDGVKVEPDKDSAVRARISKRRTVTVVAESEPFDRDMYADLEVLVRMSEEFSGQASNGDSLDDGD